MTSVSTATPVTPVSAIPFVITAFPTDAEGNFEISATGLSAPVVLPASEGTPVIGGLLIQVTNSDNSITYTIAPTAVPAVTQVSFTVADAQRVAGATVESVLTGTQYTASSTSVLFTETEAQWTIITPAPVTSSASGSSVAA